MGHTLAEKIIMKHIGGKSVKPGDLVVVEPDCVVIHDIYTAFLQDKMKKMGLTKVWNTDKIVIMHDHLMPACLEGDPRSLEAGYELVKEYGIRHFHATGGIVHQLVPELGYSKPGDIVFVTDSHTPTYGAVGCFSTGVGYTEMAAVWGTGQMWLRVPSSIKIQIDGVLPPHVYAKDIILRVLGDLGAAGGTYKSLEFCGTAIDALGIDGRMTIANMVVECGGKAGLFAADQKCADYCGVDYEDVKWVKADEDAEYERVLTYKAEDLEPVLSCPPYVDNVHPLSEVKGVRLDQVFIGSCTNGRLEDLRIAANVMKGRKISSHVKCIVTPASNSIMEALSRLEAISEKMMKSISETVELIQVNIEKVSNVNQSVTNITNDATSLGENIKVVDSAVKEVETSNQTLTDNMHQVGEVMEVMTQSISGAELTTKTMLSKYEASAKSALDIESVVGKLMEELGVGGFMGVQDVKPGMKITIALNDDSSKKEYAGEVVDCSGKDLFVTAENGVKDFVDKKNKHELCKLHIVVDNVLYYWDDIEIHPVRQGEKGQYKLHIESNPKVYNRRKYPRMPISNACTIRLEGTDKTYSGKMVNISANGFAFSVRDNVFASQTGRNVQLDVKDFAVIGNKPLTGCVIRSSNNEGEFIVGCRMPEDSEAIKEYVSRNYNGN